MNYKKRNRFLSWQSFSLLATTVLPVFFLAGMMGCSDPGIKKEGAVGHTVNVRGQSVTFVEGVHYTRLKEPFETQGNELREFFSYGCPHCYLMEPVLRSLSQKHGVEVVKHHVPLLRTMPQDAQQVLTKGLYAATALQLEQHYSDYVFHSIHQRHIHAFDIATIKQFFTETMRVSEAQVDAVLFATPPANDDALLQNVLKKGQLPGVPSLVVNGTYLIKMSSLSQTDLPAELAELTRHLQSRGH